MQIKSVSPLAVMVSALAVLLPSLAGCGADAAGMNGATTGRRAFALAAATGGEVAHAGQPNPAIAPIDSSPHGRSYAEWSADWWRWVFRAPPAISPVLDQTGEHCGVGQSGSVWFLAGTFGSSVTRDCAVPAGKALFIPLINYARTTFLGGPSITVEEMRDMLAARAETSIAAAEIDGVPIQDPLSYRAQSVVFSADFPVGPNLGVGPGDCAVGSDGFYHCHPSVADGYYLFIAPLSPGEHTLHIAGSNPILGFSVDVTYNLHVGG